MQVSEAIRTKRATRAFADRALSGQVVTAILDAGRHAQSGGNSQPGHFIAVREPTTLHALAQLGTWAAHLATAQLGVIIATAPARRGGSLGALVILRGQEQL